MFQSAQEKKNKKIGIAISLGLHAILFIIFFFIMAWREPNPPHPEYGIELNFGLDNVGSGNIQKLTPPTKAENKVEDAKPEESTKTEPVKDEVVQPKEEVAEVQPKIEAPAVDSPVKVEESKPAKVEPKPQPVKEKVTPKVENTVTEKVTKTDGAEGKKGENKESASSSHGDNKDKVGDKGDEQGKIDAKSLYGTQGGGGGASLDMAGWSWASPPKPNDKSPENGRIVFEVIVDDQGDVINVITIEKTVSPVIENLYKNAVRETTFIKTSSGRAAPRSTGRITFIIKAN